MRPPAQRLFRLVQQQQLAQVLEAVRNKLFDWTIELQTRGVSIDGDFPILPGRKQKKVAESGRTIQTTNYVEVRDAVQSPVQVASRNSSQQANYRGLDLKQVTHLLDTLERDLNRLRAGDEVLKRLMNEVATLRNVLKSPSPKHSWVRESLESIKHILEHAAGTVLGEALKDAPYVAQIGQILGMP